MKSMRVVAVLAIAATALFTHSVAAGAASLDLSKATITAKAKAITKDTMSSFDEWALMRKNKSQTWVVQYKFSWTTDGCDYSPDKPGGFDFRTPCARHDFGYANTKHLVGSTQWKNTYKLQVDKAFLFDMSNVCLKASSSAKRKTCLTLAGTYYKAVRAANA
ncbi:phospholipase A2 [Nonomuraea turcica]|uniref:phospholipase A2 n=1 Tax=Nonomuraea sp. G32 TaxID=3067274 RepID=UPI00273B6F87|nr:phospholipase A2 [Nonomuraea sp. G32]MDP4505911.1 phospholipase A2 [Nonomuraea sp. G32]